ncbi:MAG: PLP-dependent aminotransferase family protein [Acidobacteria bacterium]|nr:PLP-dependent aminotransferase family protein [Acidobacteriota bacterium]MBI3656272.1 PLP-dependent aminotransferase family protein [Acidobacteriota bacterium]
MELDVKINKQSHLPLYRQISDAIKLSITEGRLSMGFRLPPMRLLARQLAVNRNTVASAYEELIADGLIDSHVGRGTYVTEAPRDGDLLQSADAAPAKMPWEGLFAKSFDGPAVATLQDLFQVGTMEGYISFAGSYPADASLPIAEFRNCINHALRRYGRSLLKYGATSGFAPFQQFLAERMNKAGMTVQPENVLVTNGSQQALSLVAHLLLDPHDAVIVENPTYSGAISVFSSLQAKLVGMPVDGHGMEVADLEQAVARAKPKLIYCTPNYQNPTSGTMSLARRRRLLEISRRYQVPILEDDYGGELRFAGETLPSIKALDRAEQVIYMSTLSKSLIPGIRLGWVAGPVDLIGRLIAVKQMDDFSTSPLLQAAAFEFCRRRYFKIHLEKTRRLYQRRCDRMLDALARYFPKGSVWNRPTGGMFIWVWLPESVNSDAVFLEAKKLGVLFSRGNLFFIDGRGQNQMRLSFTTATEAEIEKGVRILGRIIQAFLKKSKQPRYFSTGESLPLV